MIATLTEWHTRRPVPVDLAAMAAVAGATFVAIREKPAPQLAAVTLALLVPLLWRRGYPVTVFAVVAAVAFTQIAMHWPIIPADIALCVALYTVAGRRPLRLSIPALAVSLAGQLLWAVRYPVPLWMSSIQVLLLLIVLVWTLGRLTLTKRMVVRAMREQALLTEEARECHARVAVSRERLRIARDLHDTVAHNVSVMMVQVEGARLNLDHDRTAAEMALKRVTESGRLALDDMRGMVAALREDEPCRWSQLLRDLVERMRRSGLRITEVSVQGLPDQAPLELQHTAYRVIREGLTNALKHAGWGATARVRVRFGARDAEVRVEDDGGRPIGIRLPPGGHGLVGLREQAAELGGSIVARARGTGGYQITARLPYGEGERDAA